MRGKRTLLQQGHQPFGVAVAAAAATAVGAAGQTDRHRPGAECVCTSNSGNPPQCALRTRSTDDEVLFASSKVAARHRRSLVHDHRIDFCSQSAQGFMLGSASGHVRRTLPVCPRDLRSTAVSSGASMAPLKMSWNPGYHATVSPRVELLGEIE